MQTVPLWLYEDYACRRMTELERDAEKRRIALRFKRALRRPKS